MQTDTATTLRQSASEPSDTPHGPVMVSVKREVWQEVLARANAADGLRRELGQMQALLDGANARPSQATEELAEAIEQRDRALGALQATEQRPGLLLQASQHVQRPAEPLPIINRMQAYADALRRHA